MKITHNKVGRNLDRTSDINDSGKLDKTKQVGSEKKSEAFSKSNVLSDLEPSAKINVSSQAQEMKKAKEVAMAAPDVDEAKVARLQKLIDEGKYKVKADEVADKMINAHLDWE